jgi:hypothetical protein
MKATKRVYLPSLASARVDDRWVEIRAGSQHLKVPVDQVTTVTVGPSDLTHRLLSLVGAGTTLGTIRLHTRAAGKFQGWLLDLLQDRSVTTVP